jgi:hypothetical protein
LALSWSALPCSVGREVAVERLVVARRLDRLAQRPHGLQRLLQALSRLLDAVLEQAGHVLLVEAVERARGVVLDRPRGS